MKAHCHPYKNEPTTAFWFYNRTKTQSEYRTYLQDLLDVFAVQKNLECMNMQTQLNTIQCMQ